MKPWFRVEALTMSVYCAPTKEACVYMLLRPLTTDDGGTRVR